MNTKRATRRILATTLTLILTLGAMTHSAVAEENVTEAGGEITAFEPPSEDTAHEAVPVGEAIGIVPMAISDYNVGDVQAMNEIISQTGNVLPLFTAGALNPPAQWNNVVIWDKTVYPYKIKTLELSGLGMTGQLHIVQGKFDVLEVLNCDNNDLTELTVTGNPTLRSLNCDNNQILSIILGNTDNLEELSCNGNQLKVLSVNRISSLSTLHCDSNPLTSLDVSGMPALTELSCKDNSNMTSLNVQGCGLLESIDCSSSKLARLDLSGLASLRALHCRDNELENLVLGSSTSLQLLYCQNNRLYDLDMSGLDPTNDYANFNYDLSGQAPSLGFNWTEDSGFSATVNLQSPIFGSAEITYADGVLKSTDRLVASTAFTVSPQYQFGGGTATAVLDGVLHFAYEDPTGTSSKSDRSSSGSGGRDAVAVKTQLPASAFSWDGDRTLTISHDRISTLGLFKVEWDGAATTSYRVHEGSAMVRFDRAFMDSQKAGAHSVRVEFVNHYGETTVTVGTDTRATDIDNVDSQTHNPQTGGIVPYNPQFTVRP